MRKRHDGSHGEECFGCRIQGIQFSPSAMPSRRNNIPPARSRNNWEKGVVRDDRGLPIRKADGGVIGLHEYQGNRSQIDEQVKAVKNGLI